MPTLPTMASDSAALPVQLRPSRPAGRRAPASTTPYRTTGSSASNIFTSILARCTPQAPFPIPAEQSIHRSTFPASSKAISSAPVLPINSVGPSSRDTSLLPSTLRIQSPASRRAFSSLACFAMALEYRSRFQQTRDTRRKKAHRLKPAMLT